MSLFDQFETYQKPTLTLEDTLTYESLEDEYNTLHENLISNLGKIELSIEAETKLNISLERDKKDDRDKHLSLEEFLEVAEMVEYESDFLEKLDMLSNEDMEASLTLENIVEEKQTLGTKLKKFLDRQIAALTEDLHSLVALGSLLKKYNTNKLEYLKDKIANGELVPKNYITMSDQTRLNKKLGIFYAMGYDLKTSTKGLIEFLNYPIDLVVKDKLYHETIRYVYDNLVQSKSNEVNLKKSDASIKILDKFKSIKFNSNVRDIKVVVLVKYLSNEISLVSITQTNDKGTDIHTDIVPAKMQKDINPLDKNEVLKLIDFGISNKDRISELSSITKNQLLREIIKSIRSQLATSFYNFIFSIFSFRRRLRQVFLADRFYANMWRHLLILNKEVLTYDKLIIDYINSTYERKEK